MNGSPDPANHPLAGTPPSAPPPPPVGAAPPPASAGRTRYAAPPGATQALQRRSPFVAGLLSLLPGVGQIYVGYYRLGFIHNVIFGMTIAFLASGSGPFSPFPSLVPAAAVFLPCFVVYNIVDATRRAIFYNLALDGVEGIELPNMNMDLSHSLPGVGGSVGGGVLLILVSVILLSNTLLGVSLDWLAAWWPTAPLGLGIYLLARGLQERRTRP